MQRQQKSLSMLTIHLVSYHLWLSLCKFANSPFVSVALFLVLFPKNAIPAPLLVFLYINDFS